MRIVVNRVVSHRRRRLLSLVPLPFAGRVARHGAEPDAIIELDEDRRLVRAALERLPEEQRRVIVLRYFLELSVPDIARAMGLREGTVKSRLHRALQRLRATLENAQRSDGS
jgi:RNA polymerase sigma-70 factor (ECF subfamily)